MANDPPSWPIIVIMLAVISTIVVVATLLANFVHWLLA